ncbi:sensor histidine kinase [Phormidesmis sp. 146-33]
MTNREVAQQIAAMRGRLAELRDRIQVDPIQTDLQTQIVGELQAALAVLETAQETITHIDPLPAESPPVDPSPLAQGEILLREIHHRVKNNLQLVASLLDLQMMQTDDPGVRDLLQSNQSRIRLIALLHQSLSESPNLTEINFSEYVRSLATTIFRVYAVDPDRIKLRLEEFAEVSVHSDKAIPVGLILNELISNALKHGFDRTVRGEVRLDLRVGSDGEVTLSVTNSSEFSAEGSGFADFDLNSPNSLGLQLVQSLVRQINGVLEIEQSDPSRATQSDSSRATQSDPSRATQRDRTTFTIRFNRQNQERP